MFSRTTLFTALSLAVSSLAPAFAAEDALVFDLRPSPAKVVTAAPKGVPPKAAAPKPRAAVRTAPAPKPSRTNLASRQSSDGTLLGKIGHINTHGTPIYDGPGQGKVYNRCAVGQPVILIGYNETWYGVRMIDGRTGWVHRAYVQLSEASIRLPDTKPRPSAPSSRMDPGASVAGLHPMLYTAFGYMGIPYKWGGTSSNGIDCSGFVQSVYKKFGATLPRVARDQARVGISVPTTPEHLRPGDRLYFKASHKYIDHTGIYWGNGLMIHSSGGRGVDITPLWDGGLYERSLVSARRTFAPLP